MRPPRAKLANARRFGAIGFKAFSFAQIGAVNTAVDYSVFLVARAALKRIPPSDAPFTLVSDRCRCSSRDILLLIAANMISPIAATGWL
jgi:hypothetical protein